MNNDYMKGHACPYKPIECQEGWCSECQIWKEYYSLGDDEYEKRMGGKE